jgi:ferredoxin
MKASVDRTKCQGHSRCFQIAPELFRQDEQGFAFTSGGDVPAGLEAKAREAELNCPETAIVLSE